MVPFGFKGISFIKLKDSKVYQGFQKGKFMIVFSRFQKADFQAFTLPGVRCCCHGWKITPEVTVMSSWIEDNERGGRYII